jgi:hypothetical protein
MLRGVLIQFVPKRDLTAWNVTLLRLPLLRAHKRKRRQPQPLSPHIQIGMHWSMRHDLKHSVPS